MRSCVRDEKGGVVVWRGGVVRGVVVNFMGWWDWRKEDGSVWYVLEERSWRWKWNGMGFELWNGT